MLKKFSSTVQIRPSDVDMNYHIHFTKYLEYILLARYDQMERCYRYPIDRFSQQGFSWVVKNMSLNFKSPVLLKDNLIVSTWIMDIQQADCQIGVEFLKNKKEIALDGTITFTLVDLKTGRTRFIPPEMKEYFLSFKDE